MPRNNPFNNENNPFNNEPHAAAGQQIGPMQPAFEYLQANFDAAVLERLYDRRLEWFFVIPIRIVVPASGNNDVTVDIKSGAHFDSRFVTGDFTTLNVGPVDAGTNLMSARFTDASNDLKLSDAFVPLNLMLSPGRSLSAGVAGNASNSLFYPFPFEHIFPASGGIGIEVANAGTFQNVVNFLFWGKKLRASEKNTPQE